MIQDTDGQRLAAFRMYTLKNSWARSILIQERILTKKNRTCN